MLPVRAVLVGLMIAAAAGAPEGDRITSLPGLSSLPSFEMYSGYVTVDEGNGRALFYFFAESQGNPATDPVLVWLQGGPGALC